MFLATLAAVLAASAPAIAKEAPAAPTSSQAEAAPSKQRYCVVFQIPGSILPQRTCKTLKDWRAEGFDPLAKR